MCSVIMRGRIPFSISNHNGLKVRKQVDATDEETAALIEEHKDDPNWIIMYKTDARDVFAAFNARRYKRITGKEKVMVKPFMAREWDYSNV